MDKQIVKLLIGSTTMLGFTGMVCVTGLMSSKDHKAVKKFNNVLKDISSEDIKDEIVEKAVNKAVETKLAAMSLDSCRKTISSEVKASVEKAYDETKDTVQKKLKAQCDSVNLDDIIIEVQNQAVDAAMKHINSYMDDITNDYKRRLSRLIRDSYGTDSSINIKLL